MRKVLCILLVVATVLSFSAVSFAEYKGKVTFEVNLKDAEKAAPLRTLTRRLR